jgi:hypothetical protein
MEDSDLTLLSNTAHYYMECSNKGICDRTTGLCNCYNGYEGVACQRASCPGYPKSCSGHGVCKTIKQLAEEDNGNIYRLWDKDSTMGCSCDAGYFGPDCSYRQCKYGVDPLYLDDVSTVKYSIFDVAVLTTATSGTLFSDGRSEYNNGHFAIRFYDSFDEDWLTDPIPAGATCAEVVTALENLPNEVIPENTVQCTRTTRESGTAQTNWANYDAQHPYGSAHQYLIAYNLSLWNADTGVLVGELSPQNAITAFKSSFDQVTTEISGYIYRLKFYGNPGKLKQPEVELYLDGSRPSLVSPDAKVITAVWTDGQQGEDKDYIADHCDSVTVTISRKLVDGHYKHYLDSFSSASERNLLKACLGSADFNTDNNVDVYNWDYGSYYYPHLIKLVRTVTSYNDGGYYAAIYYDTTVTYDNLADEGTFILVNPFFPPDSFSTDRYEVYATKGTLAIVSNYSQATFGFGSRYIFTTNLTYDVTSSTIYDGDVSCTGRNESTSYYPFVNHCLNKGDLFTFLNWDYTYNNPPRINLYTAERLYTQDFQVSVDAQYGAYASSVAHNPGHYMTHYITTDLSTNWGVSVFSNSAKTISDTKFHLYKFFPATASTYEYVAPCANRGICDRSAGTCNCFAGYTSDDCSEQSSLAI